MAASNILARLSVVIGADTSNLEKAMKAIKAQMADPKLYGMGQAFVYLGKHALTAANAVWDATKAFSKAGDDIEKMATRTGMSSRFISEMGFAAERSGTNIQAVEMAVKGMSKQLQIASIGGQVSIKNLQMLSMTVDDFKGLSAEDAFIKVADAIGKLPGSMDRAAAAQSMFGRSGMQLLPMLTEGGKGIEALRERARELGISMGTRDSKAAAAFVDAMTDLNTAFTGLYRTIGSAVAPVLTPLINDFATWVGGVKEMVDEMGGMDTQFKLAMSSAEGFFDYLGTALIDAVQSWNQTIQEMVDSTVAAFNGMEDVIGPSLARILAAGAGGPLGAQAYEYLMGGNREEDRGTPRNEGERMRKENEQRMKEYGQREEARRLDQERIRKEGQDRIAADKRLAEEEDKNAPPALDKTGIPDMGKKEVKAPEEVISGSFGATSAASMFLGARKDNVATQQLEESRQQTQLLQVIAENTGEASGAGGLE